MAPQELGTQRPYTRSVRAHRSSTAAPELSKAAGGTATPAKTCLVVTKVTANTFKGCSALTVQGLPLLSCLCKPLQLLLTCVLCLAMALAAFLLLLLQPVFAFLTACLSLFSPLRLLDFSPHSSSVPSFTLFPQQETKLGGVGIGLSELLTLLGDV